VSSDFVLVDWIASKLKSAGLSISIGSVVLSKKLLATAHEKHVTSGRRPVSLAASALYISCRIEGDGISQQDVAFAASITEVTVRKVYKFLIRRLGIILPVNEQRKYEAKLSTLKVSLEGVLRLIDYFSLQLKESKAELSDYFSMRLKESEAERDSLLLEVSKLRETAKFPQNSEGIKESS
jgi:hypothetical protein